MASVFNQIAVNNNKSVLSLKLNLSLKAVLSLQETKDGIPLLRYQVKLQKISGSTRFRSFSIDSLLVPEKVLAEIRVYKNNLLLDSLVQVISLNQQQILLPVSYKTPLNELYVTFFVRKIIYTGNNRLRFARTAAEINHYYGYYRIIKKLPNILHESAALHPPASQVFINYVALTRLVHYIHAHHFPQRLHLARKDPLHFRRNFAAVLRKQTRMKTLSEEILDGNKPTPFMDKVVFARTYAGLSMQAVALAKEQQPFTAASFQEYARIFPNNGEKDFITTLMHYYDRNDPPGRATVAQEIYKAFIDAASLYVRKQSYVTALDFLSNAAYLEHAFTEVKCVPGFDTLLVQARDGLGSSYLKVAVIAVRSGDDRLASGYLKRAAKSLKYHHETIPPPKTAVCYTNTAEGFTNFAASAAQNSHYRQALKLLSAANKACPQLPSSIALKETVCTKMLEKKMEIIRTLLQQNQTKNAYNILLNAETEIPAICGSPSDSIGKEQMKESAGKVFDQLLGKSRKLLTQGDIREVMAHLRKASLLQNRFLLRPSPLLDSLIGHAIEPYILSLTQDARLEIWKKHFQKADSIYRQAQDLSLLYRISNNNDIRSTLNALSDKIEIAGCQWKQEEISRLFTQANRSIKAYQIDAARSYFLKAKALHAGITSCHQNNKQLKSTFATYEELFRFADEYHRLTQQLFSKGFVAVLPGFVKLDKQYHDWHLKKFGLPFTGLYPFIKGQHSEKLIMEAVRYFIQKKEYDHALRYLQLSENPAKAKTEQKQIALGMAHTEFTPESRQLQTPAFACFAKTYRKARLAKRK